MKKNHLMHVLISSIKHNVLLVIVLIFSIVSTLVLTLLPPLILEKIVNLLVSKVAVPFILAIFYFGSLLLSGIFESIREASITIFGEKVLHELRSEMSLKLNRIPSSYLINHDAGEIAAFFVGDVDTIETLFNNGVISMIADACTVIGIIVVVFSRSIGLGILLCIFTPFLMIYTRHVQKKMLVSQKENRQAIAKASEIIPETLKNELTIHNLDAELFMESKYEALIKKSHSSIEKSNYYDSIYSPIVIVLSALIIAIMMVLSTSSNTMQSLFSMSVGTAAALITYVGKVFTPLESIGMEIQNIQTSIAGISRINSFLNEEEIEPIEACHSFHFDKDSIDINHVSFSYDSNHTIIHDFNLKVKQNEIITITGRTGAGKSTLFKLILGLYKCDVGFINIYGVSSTSIQEKDKRLIYGCVEQEFKPTFGTLKDQITLHDLNVNDEEVKRALNDVGLEERILDLDKTFISSSFSQGELQLLSIARAIVKNPKILLLDEMTANLDALTEKEIIDVLMKASNNRTVLSISHRTYSTRNSKEVSLNKIIA